MTALHPENWLVELLGFVQWQILSGIENTLMTKSDQIFR